MRLSPPAALLVASIVVALLIILGGLTAFSWVAAAVAVAIWIAVVRRVRRSR